MSYVVKTVYKDHSNPVFQEWNSLSTAYDDAKGKSKLRSIESVEVFELMSISRFAKTVEEATHRFATIIRWGFGYVGRDGFKYIVANSDDDALLFAAKHSSGLEMKHMQYKLADGTWEFCVHDET